jgi:hypothetical protein
VNALIQNPSGSAFFKTVFARSNITNEDNMRSYANILSNERIDSLAEFVQVDAAELESMGFKLEEAEGMCKAAKTMASELAPASGCQIT